MLVALQYGAGSHLRLGELKVALVGLVQLRETLAHGADDVEDVLQVVTLLDQALGADFMVALEPEHES